MRMFVGVVFALLLVCQPFARAAQIEHVIALMLENRSFDHMVGLMKMTDADVDGCLPFETSADSRQCQNPADPQQAQTWYPVTVNPEQNCSGGPGQSYVDTLRQVYGNPATSAWSNLTALTPNMTGFVADYSQQQRIMACWLPHRVPAITTLAREFALFQRYFASVPGQTEPNRVFFFSATSRGYVDDSDAKVAEGWPQRTIFQNIDESSYNRTWSVYYTDEPSALFMDYPRKFPERLFFMDQFYTDAQQGNLASFVFLEPRYNNDDLLGEPSQDQEAPHNVGQGDRLIKQVYEAIRASPLWEKTLFIICYDGMFHFHSFLILFISYFIHFLFYLFLILFILILFISYFIHFLFILHFSFIFHSFLIHFIEHGGFFDHIAPPQTNVPSPDGITSRDSTPPGFNFDRLGVRLPFVLVSPWIQKGLKVGEPPSGAYEHASMSSTLINLLVPDMPYLTARDKWAAPFDWVVNTQSAPRTDCPTTLPEAPITDVDLP